ncbi:MAG: aminotransferase class V-fold PLP-dependent enzyme [Planctomycetota bacterium]|nr:aminotransferase class V-fold PLP-dependent enzyme [Planctomycetota bacterium]
MLWIPGPTQVRPELLQEMARPAIGHRTKAMTDVIERIHPHLRFAFGLDENSTAHPAVHSTSATGMMEAGLIGAGQKILCLVNGAFSKRWADIAKALGKDVTVLEAEWGQVVSMELLDQTLTEQGPFDSITYVMSETSTGTLTPPEDIAAVMAKHPDTLVFTDVVSAIAGRPIDFDKNGIDFAFAGVQKAFALPPGVAVVCASDRYMEKAKTVPNRGFYLDPINFIEGHEKRKTPITPAIPHYFALAKQLEDISAGKTLRTADQHLEGAEAWAARFAKHSRMQARTIDWAKGHGLTLLPELRQASPCVACINSGNVDVPALIAGLKEEGFILGNGYGKLKNITFRIGHMGDHTEEGLEDLLAAADRVLAKSEANSPA